ncbi:MAG TPA: EAL domain-containing protein [Gaiellales bacterium]|nr:EAL domain-containing protein [Gaiellales bacterium]
MASADRLRALVDLSRALSSSLDLEDVLRCFTAHATAVNGAAATAVSLWERDRDVLITLTDYENHIVGQIAEADVEYALGDFPLSRRVMEERSAVVVRASDPECDPHERSVLLKEGYETMLMLPLVSRGETIGLMEFADVTDRSWDPEMEFFGALTDVVAAAVHNAVLHDEFREAQERYRVLVENLPAITYVDLAGSGDPLYVSPQIEELMGIPADEWLDGFNGWERRMHPDDRHTIAEYRRTVETGEPYSASYRMQGLDGRMRWFRDDAAAVRDETGTPRFIQGVIFDVTKQKEAEGALQASEARFREMLENVRLAAVVTDLEGRITFCNEYLAELSGWWEDELLGRIWSETFTPPDELEMEQRAQRGIERGSVIAHYESSILTRSGERRLFSWNNTLLRDANGDVVGQASVGEDITDRRRAEHELERLAFHDPLTGLPNRILFHEHLDVALARAQRAGCGVAVLYVDLDDFKLVNDSFGHNAGDELLCEVAARLTGSTRAADVVARQGGDEFLILIADVETNEGGDVVDVGDVARRVAEQVRAELQRPLMLADTEIYTSASLGISLYPADAPDAESLLKHADIAMYKAKESGRDGYQLFSSTGHDPRAQLSMAGRLRRAVERDQLMLHYQPLVSLATGEYVGAEALLRWQDDQNGLVMPGDFIPLAERTGLIGPISEWVIEEACRQSAEWRSMGLDLYVSVNLPAVFWQPTAMRQVLATIERFGLSADRMMVEITESTVMADALRSEPIIAELHERGLRLAIDDFGTGHSSLARLNQMLVTTLKIDRSFIADLPGDPSAAVLVATIIQLAHNLGLHPLAEGIETEEQRTFLVENGCQLGQGFLFSKAVPADRIVALHNAMRDAA